MATRRIAVDVFQPAALRRAFHSRQRCAFAAENAPAEKDAPTSSRPERRRDKGSLLFSLMALKKWSKAEHTNYFMEEMKDNTAYIDGLANRLQQDKRILKRRVDDAMRGWEYAAPGKDDEVAYIKTFRHIFPGDLLVKHPADSKVVALFHTDLLKNMSEKQLETMKVVAGRRFLEQFHEIRVSAQKDGWTAAQNEIWCKEALQKLLSIAKLAPEVDVNDTALRAEGLAAQRANQ